MKSTPSKTAGKRTARPGSRRANTEATVKVAKNKSLPAKAGKRTAAMTTRHIVAHTRSVGQKRRKGKS